MRQSAVGFLKGGPLFGRFLKNFPWSPLCTFSENGAFGWPCENCHNLAIRALLDPLFEPKSFAVFALQVHTKQRIMFFAPECFWAFQTRATFWAIFEKFPLVPPLLFFQKMRVLGDVAKIVITWSFGTFWSCFLPQSLLQSLHYKWIQLEDNDICARVLLAFWSEGYFSGDFWKTSLGLPFVLFLKMQVLGDLPKSTITSPFGPFLSRCLRLNLLQSLHFKRILIRG